MSKPALQLLLFALVLTLFFAVATPFASAKYVTMSTTLGPTAIPGGASSFNLSVKLANSGDDTAYRVSASAWSALPQLTASEASAGDLGPGESAQTVLPLAIETGAP